MALFRNFAARNSLPLLQSSCLVPSLARRPTAISTRNFAAAAFAMTGKDLIKEIKVRRSCYALQVSPVYILLTCCFSFYNLASGGSRQHS